VTNDGQDVGGMRGGARGLLRVGKVEGGTTEMRGDVLLKGHGGEARVGRDQSAEGAMR
jgi:hypothetical protein